MTDRLTVEGRAVLIEDTATGTLSLDVDELLPSDDDRLDVIGVSGGVMVRFDADINDVIFNPNNVELVALDTGGGNMAIRRGGSDHIVTESGGTRFEKDLHVNGQDVENANWVSLSPQDVRTIGSPSQGMTAYHDGSGTNTEGPAHHDGTDWISTVDGATIT